MDAASQKRPAACTTLLGGVLALGTVFSTPATAADLIFADGFESCCTLGGHVFGPLNSGLVLHLDSGSVSETRLINPGDGPLLYTFTHTVPTGTTYTIKITTHPDGQSCVPSNASGAMGSAPVENADVSCGDSLNWDDDGWDNAAWN